MTAALRSLAASLATTVPWCCIAPTALAVSGIATAGVASWVQVATPFLLLASAEFVMRAVYLSCHGRGRARMDGTPAPQGVSW
jgi:hypothetical protein